MMAYKADWYGTETFRLIPTTTDCPYTEAVYDPSTKVLAVIGKTPMEKAIMLPKLNDKGQPIMMKGADPKQPNFVEERRIMATLSEYYLESVDDITAFINMFVMNPEHTAISKALEQSV
jgi:hypothetical protein